MLITKGMAFTPVASSLGGVLIGTSAALLLLLGGRIAGISGIVGGLLTPLPDGERSWRLAFLIGLLGGGALVAAWLPGAFGSSDPPGQATLIVGGLLVGVGTRLGCGCTSGHGVCGIGRLSARSLVATATFLLTGMLVVFVAGQGWG